VVACLGRLRVRTAVGHLCPIIVRVSLVPVGAARDPVVLVGHCVRGGPLVHVRIDLVGAGLISLRQPRVAPCPIEVALGVKTRAARERGLLVRLGLHAAGSRLLLLGRDALPLGAPFASPGTLSQDVGLFAAGLLVAPSLARDSEGRDGAEDDCCDNDDHDDGGRTHLSLLSAREPIPHAPATAVFTSLPSACGSSPIPLALATENTAGRLVRTRSHSTVRQRQARVWGR
jgi:hypothetical protein